MLSKEMNLLEDPIPFSNTTQYCSIDEDDDTTQNFFPVTDSSNPKLTKCAVIQYIPILDIPPIPTQRIILSKSNDRHWIQSLPKQVKIHDRFQYQLGGTTNAYPTHTASFSLLSSFYTSIWDSDKTDIFITISYSLQYTELDNNDTTLDNCMTLEWSIGESPTLT